MTTFLALSIPDLPEAYDPLLWSINRLHPGEPGHRLLAAGIDPQPTRVVTAEGRRHAAALRT